MKQNYTLAGIAAFLILMLLLGFRKKESNVQFIEIYRSQEYTLFASRESPTSAWIKWQYPTKRVKGKNGKYIITGGKSTLTLWKCSCYNRTYDFTNMIEYDRNGKVIRSSDYGSYNQPVVPGSVGEVVFNHICANDDESYFYDEWDVIDSAAAVVDTLDADIWTEQ